MTLTVDDRELIEALSRFEDRYPSAVTPSLPATVRKAKARLQSLLSDKDKLVSALERLDRNFDLLLAGKPVRDVAETKAETRAALTQTEVP